MKKDFHNKDIHDSHFKDSLREVYFPHSFKELNKDEIDYVGVTFFLNETWNFQDGGLFLFKQDNADRGEYVEPIGNRIVINNEDLYHAVTKIVTPDVKRRSLHQILLVLDNCIQVLLGFCRYHYQNSQTTCRQPHSNSNPRQNN